jgi:hypothetical protein
MPASRFVKETRPLPRISRWGGETAKNAKVIGFSEKITPDFI